MGLRLTPLFPLVTSIISFSLILALVISGSQPDSIPDGFLLTFNTTSVGKNLVQFSPITPATTATAASVISNRSTITNSSTSSTESTNTSLSAQPNVNISMSATANSNSTAVAAPMLNIPQAAVTSTTPAAIPIALIGTFFQLTLNTLASGMGDALQAIIALLVTTTKQTNGVQQYYTMHATGLCEGSVFDTNATNLTSPFNVTSCISYRGAGAYIANLTRNVSDSTFVGATNITIPFLSKVPGFGQSGESFINLAAGIVLAVFIIGLIGNGLSIMLSAAAIFQPSYGRFNFHTAGAAITTLSTQLLQMAAITSTVLAVSISSTVNKLSDVSGFSVTVGGKFLALVWVGYISAQMANSYWITSWFVRYRTISYKARERTLDQMGNYKDIKKEILSDLRVQEVDYYDTERLTVNASEIKHWDETYKQM